MEMFQPVCRITTSACVTQVMHRDPSKAIDSLRSDAINSEQSASPTRAGRASTIPQWSRRHAVRSTCILMAG
ncbi:hypothetical protein GCM10027598_47190 [Amycolatopsis oliviviridis]|uniref:Uncharacterized protein n=1 Tax=Amycolatopsis oliviviridis TaxID=1471590 RepID=A0ABQ3MCH8_9PSEU|nr:hypothetical protein GCM10017790_84290 [Amycolatopsis oliviviridis]